MPSPCRSPVPYDRAERSSRAGHPLPWVAGFVLLVLVVGVLAYQSLTREVITPTAPRAAPTPAEATRADAATDLLQDLTDALTRGNRRDAMDLAAPDTPGARANLGWLHDNIRDLGITDLSMRFVDEEAGESTDTARRTLGDNAWVADVALSWRVDGFDTAVSSMEVPITLVDTGDEVAFGSSTGDSGTTAPLWLLDDLAVAESRRALVSTADGEDLKRYSRLANRAVRTVRQVLPEWRTGLVVEVPDSQTQLHRLLDAKPGSYDSIAAVTAIVDGSQRPSAPVHILINPNVFGKLGEDGSQIVMSHEAAHVAVDAATSTMPLWLLEGFADYVALARSDLPVELTASQILDEVRKNGPPRSLPGADEFDPSNKLLGTSYEAAWLACQLLAEEYGEERLVDFYTAVEEGQPVEEAFADLGTTEKEFTQAWRAYLRELA